MVKCPQCNSILRVKSAHYRKSGIRMRHRVCDNDKCKYTTNTMELDVIYYNKLIRLIEGLKRIVREYLDNIDV